jgi:hypothetical protein
MTLARNSLVSLAVALALTACGGSSGGSSGGGQTGGVQVTQGAITSVSSGTITVNGVALATSGAQVVMEKSAAAASALKEGMIVTVRGTFDDRTGSASEVEFEDALTGTVDDKGADHLVIGGRTVQIDDSTRFEHGLEPGSVALGHRVRVSGVPDDRGGVRASRIDSPSDASEDFEVKGYVSALSASGFELRLFPGATDLWNVTLAQGVSLPQGIADGAFVEVRAVAAPSGADLVASKVALEDDAFAEATEVELEGIVSAGGSSAFTVAGQEVVTDGSTRWIFGAAADLLPGVKVEVSGHSMVDGKLLAEKVAFRAVVRLQAAAANVVVDGAVTRFTLMGIPVSVSSLTDDRMGVALAEGVTVEVRGIPGNDGLSVSATRIEDTNDQRLVLEGVVTAADAGAGSVQILGLTGASDGGTEYHPHGAEATSLSRADFFAQVQPGLTVVKVRGRDAGSLSGTTLTAKEMELEDHE